jgi:hypothetical protein
VWRSPVARSHGVREVVGSNPVTPTFSISKNSKTAFYEFRRRFFIFFHIFNQQNISLSNRLKQAGEFLHLSVLDQMIITRNGHYSFADQGLM